VRSSTGESGGCAMLGRRYRKATEEKSVDGVGVDCEVNEIGYKVSFAGEKDSDGSTEKRSEVLVEF
jgi:hypothetical protein